MQAFEGQCGLNTRLFGGDNIKHNLDCTCIFIESTTFLVVLMHTIAERFAWHAHMPEENLTTESVAGHRETDHPYDHISRDVSFASKGQRGQEMDEVGVQPIFNVTLAAARKRRYYNSLK